MTQNCYSSADYADALDPYKTKCATDPHLVALNDVSMAMPNSLDAAACVRVNMDLCRNEVHILVSTSGIPPLGSPRLHRSRCSDRAPVHCSGTNRCRNKLRSSTGEREPSEVSEPSGGVGPAKQRTTLRSAAPLQSIGKCGAAIRTNAHGQSPVS